MFINIQGANHEIAQGFFGGRGRHTIVVPGRQACLYAGATRTPTPLPVDDGRRVPNVALETHDGRQVRFYDDWSRTPWSSST